MYLEQRLDDNWKYSNELGLAGMVVGALFGPEILQVIPSMTESIRALTAPEITGGEAFIRFSTATIFGGLSVFAGVGYNLARNHGGRVVDMAKRLADATKQAKESYSRMDSLREEFSEYVAKFESRYGKFEKSPRLLFGFLPFGTNAVALTDYSVVINVFPINYFLGKIAHALVYKEFHDDKLTVRHELGHLVFLQILNELNPNWLRAKGNMLDSERKMKRQHITISEGVAEYLAVQNERKIHEWNVYDPYFNFVRPVLDGFGVRDGIKKLLLQPPTRQELKEPRTYYERLGLK